MKSLVVRIEFSACNKLKGICKANTLDTVLSPLGIERKDAIVTRDWHNDITVLAYNGIGVAMEKVVLELKYVTGYVTDLDEEE